MFQRDVDLVSITLAFFSVFLIIDLLAAPLLMDRTRRHLMTASFVLLMLLTLAYPVEVQPGVILDARGAVVATTFLLLGGLPAILVTVVGMLVRLLIGGDGATAGVIGLAMDLCLAFTVVTLARRRQMHRHLTVLAAGIAVGIGEALSLLLVPNGTAVFADSALALFAAQVVATMVIAVIALVAEERREEREMSLQLAQELKESDRRYHLLAENSTDVIALIDVESELVLYVSPAVEHLLGWKPDDAVGQPWTTSLEPPFAELAPRVLRDRIAAFEDGTGPDRSVVIEVPFRHNDRGTVFGEVAATLLTGDDGKVSSIICVARDITQRRLAEDALLSSDLRFRALFDQMTVGAVFQDDTGRVLKVNRAAEEILGIGAKEIQTVFTVEGRVLSEDGTVFRAQDSPGHRALSSGTVVRDVVVGLIQADESIKWLRLTSVPLDLRPPSGGDRLTRLVQSKQRQHVPSEVVTLVEDITAEREAAQELRIKEAAMASAAAGLAIIDMRDNLVYANQALLTMWGYESLEAATGTRATNLWMQPMLLADARESIRLGRVWSGELVARRADGETFDAQVSASPVPDSSGRPVRTMMSIVDVSERNRLQSQLRVQRDRLASASRAGRVTIWDWDIGRNVMTVSGYVDPGLHHLTVDESVPVETFLEAVHPDDRSVLFRLLTNHLRGGAQYEQEYRVRRDDGSWIWWRVVGALVTENEQIVRLTGVCRDITAEREVAQALAASTARLERAQHLARIGSWEFDAHTGRMELSAETYRIFGLDPAVEVTVEDCFGLAHPDDAKDVRRAFIKTVATGTRFDIEHRAVLADGRQIWIRQSGAPTQEDGALRRLHGTVQDITEHKRAQDAERLEEEKELAEQANKAKSAFLASMSHEIRTPMTAVLGFTQLLREDTGLTEQHKEYLEHIARSGEHLLQLIDDVLQMSKIEAGHLTLEPVTTDLDAMLTDLRSIFEMRLNSKGLAFEVARDDLVPRFVEADALRLRQILINLIGNATKFTVTGSVSVRVSSGRSEGDSDGARMRFAVTDTGPGIAEHECKRIFERFEQTDVGRDQRSGAGLGLAISRGLAVLMGGDITVKSTVGIGTTFTVDVPLVPRGAPLALTGTDRPGIATGQIDGSGHRILVVDDAPENRMVLSVMLRSAGFEVREASDGVEAIARFAAWHPDLVIMDLQMPRMDGAEAMRRIRQMEGGDTVRLVAATANVFDDDREQVVEAGGDGFIPKPFTKSQLLGTVAEMLGLTPVESDDTSQPVTRDLPA